MSVYYWHDNKVQHLPGFSDIPESVFGCFCIDTNCAPGKQGRVGQWGPGRWRDAPTDQLPADFRMHLLLMGIPT